MLGNEHWYAVYCKSRHEHMVHERLAAKGIVSYLASYETRAQWGTRQRKTRKNLLPGYVLVQACMDPKIYLAILQTESVVKFVGNLWPKLSWIPDEQVDSMRLLLGAPLPVEEVPYWQAGERVEVIGGPLTGLRGMVASLANRPNRVIVSIDLLRRSMAAEIDAHLLRRVRLRSVAV